MRPEQHPASNSSARKAHAEATDPHGGCKVGTCKAEDQWRTVSCGGGGGDVEALPRILSVPSEEAMQHLLDALNVSGLHPEVACGYLTGGVTFLAGLSGPDADHVHITVTEADNGVVHCCECAHPGERANEWDPNSWRPTYPVLALVTEWPDLARVVEEGFIDPWWTAALAAQPAAPQLDRTEWERGEPPSLAGKVMPVHDAGVQVAAAYQQGLADARRLAAQRPEGGGPLDAIRQRRQAGMLIGEDYDWLLAEVERMEQRPEGVTVTEWGVQKRSYPLGTGFRLYGNDEENARRAAPLVIGDGTYVISRQRTTFPDVVTEWAEVSDHTEAGGGRG